MKRILFALALMIAPVAGHAATITVPQDQKTLLSQNEYAVFDVENFDTFSLSFVNAALWSGGSILYTTDRSNTNRPWEATYLGEWSVNFLAPQAHVKKWVFDTTQSFGRWFTVNTYGKTYVHANATGGVETPAPIPLPAAGFLLLAGLGVLGSVRRRGKA